MAIAALRSWEGKMLQALSATNSADVRVEFDFRDELEKMIPFLRAFSRSLCSSDRETADDIAQDVLAKAWKSRTSFTPGTNMKAWLFTILRNEFYSNRRRAWRQQPWDQDAAEREPDRGRDQMWESELSDTMRAMRCLSDEHREALVLVAAGGLSYEDAAAICGCEVGTVKSRVSRARKRLAEILEGQSSRSLPEREAYTDPKRELMAQYDRLMSSRAAASGRAQACRGV
jgi:RNA polymerase sigma-70 factor, ECF subfamily